VRKVAPPGPWFYFPRSPRWAERLRREPPLMLGQPTRSNEVATHPIGRSHQIGGRAVRSRHPWEVEVRRRHPSARSDSMNSATSNISRRSSASASNAAISWRSASRRRSRWALFTRADLIASERERPDASSWARALCASSSRRTETAFFTYLLYHNLSYSLGPSHRTTVGAAFQFTATTGLESP